MGAPRRRVATVGITDHAQEALGDMVFVELPEPGREVAAGEACAVVESVKAASDVYAPLAGRVTETQRRRWSTTRRWSTATPTGDGWFFKLELADPAAFDALMDEAAYDAFAGERCDGRARRTRRAGGRRRLRRPPYRRRRRPRSPPCCTWSGADLDELAARTVPAAIRADARARPAAADRRSRRDRRAARPRRDATRR